MSSSVDAMFSERVTTLESWVQEQSGSEFARVLSLLQIFSTRYSLGLQLPVPNPESISNEPKAGLDQVEIDQVEIDQVTQSAQALPFQYYRTIFHPVNLDDTGLELGDISDDLLDIYKDVVSANRLYISGNQDAALWHWNHDMKTHWARHITASVHALNDYLANEASIRVAGLTKT